ncbi:MAG: PAS domain-containing sensor histidine kinase, partial [Microcystaceae cyanobacterium]
TGHKAELIEELRNSLEELSVAEEELLQQNQELAITRAEIEAERQRYQDLFELAPDGYLVTDEAGMIREANCAAARLLNVSQQYLIGKPMANFIPYAERQAFRSRMSQLRQIDWTQEWELCLTPRHGEAFDAALTVSPISRDWEGQPAGWLWLLRDITERKQAELALRKTEIVEATNQVLQKELEERQQLETALRQSEKRYRAISELTSDYTYTYYIESDGTFVPELLNESFTRVCGYTVEDIAANGWQPLIPPEDKLIILRHGKRLFAGQTDVCEHRIMTKSGEVRWVRNYARPVFDGTRRALFICGAAQDITERKKAEWERSQLFEREQAARTQAEEASRLKDEFLAIVSHELRSPLNAILGWAQLLCQQQFDTTTMERGLKIIERNARLQTTLIEDLLDISRIIRGKLNLQIYQIDLVAVIEAAIHTMQPATAAKNIHLESVLSSDIGLVSGDMERLQQIIWNLLSNAIKFTPAGGRVEIRLERDNSHAQITISDTGIGIKHDFLHCIFDIFRQSDQSSTRLHRGLGLGLAIVRHLVELHGGVI